MSLKLEPAVFKRAELLYARSDCRSEWLIIKAEFRFEDRTVVTQLVGCQVQQLCTAILGSAPKERIQKTLHIYFNKPIGVCWEQIRNRPTETRIRSFFHIKESDTVEIVPDKPRARRSKNK